MLTKLWIVPLVAAALTFAAPDKQQCGDVADIADANPACKVTAVPTRFQPLAFNISKWIWTGENLTPGGGNPVGVRALRKNFTSACGKCATCATIVITSDDTHTVYVNGVAIGAGGGWTRGQALFTALQPDSNLFTIAGNNGGGPAAVMATIKVHYSDGSSDTFITDESWKVFKGTPPQNFQLPSFDDSNWTFATLQGTWDVAHWGKPSLPPILPLTPAKWIWTSDNVKTVAPVGSRVFRKTVNDCGKRAVCATAIIAADNHYTLYVNGQTVGSGDSYTAADAWTIPKLHPAYNTFAIKATNDNGPAGVIATILVTYSDGTNATIVTDGSWKASIPNPQGFEQTFFDDADWEGATVVGNYGGPWGTLTIPPA